MLRSITVSSVTTVSADDMSLYFSGMFGATRQGELKPPARVAILDLSVFEGVSSFVRFVFACAASKHSLISIGMVSPKWRQDRKAARTFCASRRWVVDSTSSTSIPMEVSSPSLFWSKME